MSSSRRRRLLAIAIPAAPHHRDTGPSGYGTWPLPVNPQAATTTATAASRVPAHAARSRHSPPPLPTGRPARQRPHEPYDPPVDCQDPPAEPEEPPDDPHEPPDEPWRRARRAIRRARKPPPDEPQLPPDEPPLPPDEPQLPFVAAPFQPPEELPDEPPLPAYTTVSYWSHQSALASIGTAATAPHTSR